MEMHNFANFSPTQIVFHIGIWGGEWKGERKPRSVYDGEAFVIWIALDE